MRIRRPRHRIRMKAKYIISGPVKVEDPILFNLNIRRKYKGNVIIK